MYIVAFDIQNIKCLTTVNWSLPANPEKLAGWHVILGDNGSGKSTIIRSIALALVGPTDAMALRQDWSKWLRNGQSQGATSVAITRHPKYDSFTKAVRVPQGHHLCAGVWLARHNGRDALPEKAINEPDFLVNRPEHYVWASGEGWFSASYGPFRRFSGGDREDDRIFSFNRRLAAHLSAFGERIALTESIQWLLDLKFRALQAPGEAHSKLLERIMQFVNQDGFLPYDVKMESISPDGVTFKDGDGYHIDVDDLSDGYRSILSMTFELIRQMDAAYPGKLLFSKDSKDIVVPGVVLIDEVDAHLHPTWQRNIGRWFRDHFPNVQFIVTTHSPLVCQAADVGTVWKLPAPGSTEEPGFITGADLDRLRYGNILEAYSTNAFDMISTRSPAAQKRLDRLAELNVAELVRDLSDAEMDEQQQLRAVFPLEANSVTMNGKAK